MAHVAPLSDEQASGDARPIFEAIQDNFGMVPNIFRAMGHAPAALGATLQLHEAIQDHLPEKFRELAYLKTSSINGCDY